MTKQTKNTHILTIRINDTQKQSLDKLKEYDVNTSKFIRQAIKEKIQRDWKCIKESKNKTTCPF